MASIGARFLDKRIARRRFLELTFSLALLSLVGCEERNQKRPYGFIHLGKLSDLLQGKDISDKWLLLRKDAEGIYVVSTLCTRDLEPLIRTPEDIFRCPHCTSEYSLDGDIRKGPAEYPLPYYELRMDQGELEGPVDTLYAYIGVEKPRDYRFHYPRATVPAGQDSISQSSH